MIFGIIVMFYLRPCPAEPGKVRYQIPSRFLSNTDRKGINSLRPTSGCFLYLVSKGRSTGCARNDNSVSFHHAMFAHQCRNSEKYGINFFPYSSYWVRQQDELKCILKVRMYFNLRHVSASAILTKVELPKR